MNIVPKLIDNPSWATIASFRANELGEFAMMIFFCVVLIGGAAYGIYSALRRKGGRI